MMIRRVLCAAGALAVYALFQTSRVMLPHGFIQDSLPSVLCPMVLLPCLDICRAFRGMDAPLGWSGSFSCALASVLLLEGIGPRVGLGTADMGDVVAWVLGTICYQMICRSPTAGD